NVAAGIVRPFLVPVGVEVVAKVPGDVGEGAKASYRIADEAALILAAGLGMHLAVIHIEDGGNDHVAVTGELEHPVEALPVGYIVPCVVEARMEGIVRVLR